MQAFQTPSVGAAPAQVGDDDCAGGSTEVLHPLLARLQGSFGELDEQMRKPEDAANDIPPPAEDERTQLQQAHAQIAALLTERDAISKKLQSTSRTLSQAMEVVQKQRAALLDARIASDRLEATQAQLQTRVEHYQETVARLLNLPPRDTAPRR